MYKIKGTLQGTSDLLFNKMTDDDIDKIINRTTGGNITDETYKKAAEGRIHIDENGNCIIGKWMFKVTLAGGARAGKVKEGRGNIAPTLIATVFVDGDIAITPQKFDYIHAVPGKRPPKTGGACMIYRPAFRTGWTADFVLNVVDDRVSPDKIRLSLEEAGIRVGIGSWRPEFGRFIVTNWEVTK